MTYFTHHIACVVHGVYTRYHCFGILYYTIYDIIVIYVWYFIVYIRVHNVCVCRIIRYEKYHKPTVRKKKINKWNETGPENCYVYIIMSKLEGEVAALWVSYLVHVMGGCGRPGLSYVTRAIFAKPPSSI